MTKKKRKKKWTTKNTHFHQYKKLEEIEKEDIYCKIFSYIALAIAILILLIQACDNHIVGYDYFIGIPHEWVRSLHDR